MQHKLLPIFPLQHLSADLKKSREDLKLRAPQLISTTDSIQVESRKRKSIGKRRRQEKDQLCESSGKIKKLKRKRDEAARKLEFREKELEIFHLKQDTIKSSFTAKEANLLTVIAGKKMEIRDLTEKLTRVEHELRLEKVNIEELREQLRQTTAKLVEQYKRVRGLERSRAELERERSRVDTRILIEIARNKVLF